MSVALMLLGAVKGGGAFTQDVSNLEGGLVVPAASTATRRK
jgi:hypothetical protein